MPRNVPSLKPRELVRMLEAAGCRFYRQGKGDHRLFVRHVGNVKVVVPIDMGAGELSPAYVLMILRQFRFSDQEIDAILKK